MKRFFTYVRDLIRELSDQSAYARYLHASGQRHSSTAWKQFADRRYRRKYSNAKCC
ncbi:MAG TPA: hypothetical protein VKX25_07170 [Bryobacteraceae bacterium]|jgi:hypothetical protein|nr:hypothetical protein [Bryobacteraceae bacterium]